MSSATRTKRATRGIVNLLNVDHKGVGPFVRARIKGCVKREATYLCAEISNQRARVTARGKEHRLMREDIAGPQGASKQAGFAAALEAPAPAHQK